jgi:hypothetical protein
MVLYPGGYSHNEFKHKTSQFIQVFGGVICHPIQRQIVG